MYWSTIRYLPPRWKMCRHVNHLTLSAACHLEIAIRFQVQIKCNHHLGHVNIIKANTVTNDTLIKIIK